jgi:type I restriction enzyme S subunit
VPTAHPLVLLVVPCRKRSTTIYETASTHKIVLPSKQILSRYFEFIQPIYKKLYSGESRTLAALRDALLPKLLSGEIRVREAEREVEQVA